jgi:accessory gene regulator B
LARGDEVLKEIAEELSLILVTNKIIKLDNRKYYTYGIELILNDTVTFLIIGIIAISTNMLLDSVVYLLVFCILRAYAGGYHCKTYVQCLITSLTIYSFMLLLDTYIANDLKLIISFILMAISCPVIFIFAPISNENSPVTEAQEKKYKLFSRILVIAIIVVFTLSISLANCRFSFEISWAMFAVFILMLASKILLIERGQNHEKEHS